MLLESKGTTKKKERLYHFPRRITSSEAPTKRKENVLKINVRHNRGKPLKNKAKKISHSNKNK